MPLSAPDNPPSPDVTKVPRKAPVRPLYFSTLLALNDETYMFPSGPHATPVGESSPPDPGVTNCPT